MGTPASKGWLRFIRWILLCCKLADCRCSPPVPPNQTKSCDCGKLFFLRVYCTRQHYDNYCIHCSMFSLAEILDMPWDPSQQHTARLPISPVTSPHAPILCTASRTRLWCRTSHQGSAFRPQAVLEWPLVHSVVEGVCAPSTVAYLRLVHM